MSDHRTKFGPWTPKAEPQLLPWPDLEPAPSQPLAWPELEPATLQPLAWPEIQELAAPRLGTWADIQETAEPRPSTWTESKPGPRQKQASHSTVHQPSPRGSWIDLFIGTVGTLQNPTFLPTKEIEREIERIYELAEESPSFVADELNRILNSLGEATDLGRARLRLIIRSIPEIPLGDTPKWLASQLDALQSEDESQLPSGLAAATSRLVRSALAASSLPGMPANRSTAEISAYMGGRIEVAWKTRSPLRWIVDTAFMPWPGINVRAYTAVQEGSHVLQCTRFHFAGSLVRQASAILKRESE